MHFIPYVQDEKYITNQETEFALNSKYFHWSLLLSIHCIRRPHRSYRIMILCRRPYVISVVTWACIDEHRSSLAVYNVLHCERALWPKGHTQFMKRCGTNGKHNTFSFPQLDERYCVEYYIREIRPILWYNIASQ